MTYAATVSVQRTPDRERVVPGPLINPRRVTRNGAGSTVGSASVTSVRGRPVPPGIGSGAHAERVEFSALALGTLDQFIEVDVGKPPIEAREVTQSRPQLFLAFDPHREKLQLGEAAERGGVATHLSVGFHSPHPFGAYRQTGLDRIGPDPPSDASSCGRCRRPRRYLPKHARVRYRARFRNSHVGPAAPFPATAPPRAS